MRVFQNNRTTAEFGVDSALTGAAVDVSATTAAGALVGASSACAIEKYTQFKATKKCGVLPQLLIIVIPYKSCR